MSDEVHDGGKNRKALANRKAYLGEKERKDRILLRLPKGEAELFDAACAAAGLCRSEFFRRHLMPMANSAASPESPTAAPACESVANEFDELFQSGR